MTEIFLGYGWTKTQIGECRNGEIYSGYGWGKSFLHEGGIRVPAIFSWPGKIQPNSETDHISGFQDMMPTFAELVNIECPPTDGISLLPTLLGDTIEQKEHDYLYFHRIIFVSSEQCDYCTKY